ncbi:OmpW/AlkL family protein [Flavobacterium sp. JP2137]|uniref:OmpW/AlkL family protein n=1 Tax=Flavobacterium sp. JP2137 TaxID=3414510 RepID=UPI003D2FF98C
MKKIFLTLLSLTLFTGSVMAQEQQEQKEPQDYKKWMVRVRGVGVVPNESATIGTIGGGVSLSNSFIPELDFTYFFTKNIAAELILGTTKHNVNTTSSDLTAVGLPNSVDVDLGSVWLLPPTLMAQYHVYAGDVFKPYVGAGVNYTIFHSKKTGNTVQNVDYKNKFGYAFQIGFDIDINDTFFINFDVKKIFLKTDVTVDASNLAGGPLDIPADVTIDPLLLGFGVGMRF